MLRIDHIDICQYRYLYCTVCIDLDFVKGDTCILPQAFPEPTAIVKNRFWKKEPVNGCIIFSQ